MTNCRGDFSAADNLPWYWDEDFIPWTFDCSIPHEVAVPPRIPEIDFREEEFSLLFFDAPQDDGRVEFLTILVGVNADGSGNVLDRTPGGKEIRGTGFRWFYDGSDGKSSRHGDLSVANSGSFGTIGLVNVADLPSVVLNALAASGVGLHSEGSAPNPDGDGIADDDDRHA